MIIVDVGAIKNLGGFKRYSKDTLYRNSFYMIINKGLVAATGLVFWVIAARFYSVSNIGLATTLISASMLITSFSTFGFEISLVRFLKSFDRAKAFYTCLFFTMGSSFFLAILYIVFVRYLSPDLSFIQETAYAIFFILFTVIDSIGIITTNTFIALRDAKYSFLQNLLLTTRVLAIIPLAFLGILGILGANFFGYILTYSIILIFLTRFIPFKPQVDKEFFNMSFTFSFGNYVANILYNAAFLALPIIVLDLRGSTAAGIYYIAYTVGNFLLQVPIALGISFFVEGVYGEDIWKNIVKTGTAMIMLLVPGIAIFWVFGSVILGFFGNSYTGAIDLLRLVAISSLPYAVYSVFQPMLNIRMRIKEIILLNLAIFVLLIGLSYAMVSVMGILGVGYALIATFLIIDVLILSSIKWWGLSSFIK
jgi:O-antigen/teichoic acid export membrane protein